MLTAGDFTEIGPILNANVLWHRILNSIDSVVGKITLGPINTLTPPPVVQGGEEVDGSPPLEFCCASIFRKEFTFGR